ncbi:hypothetical protein AHF37_11248 [Paragonimus kellicotti]|nr:hypothetical protein AHF37_11248 [Paragonimus kellicotti]
MVTSWQAALNERTRYGLYAHFIRAILAREPISSANGDNSSETAQMECDALCDFWICSDVLCCTASILHLVGIALDRYWAVTNAEYIRRRTARRIGFMIAIFWLLSLAISMPARFDYVRLSSWIQPANLSLQSTEEVNCVINEEYGYTIFSNVGAFYMPMLFMIGIYARIYQVARARIRRSRFRKNPNSTDEQSDYNFNARINPSLRTFVPDSSLDKTNDLYRSFWNGVSHSAPASTYNIDRLIAFSNSTSDTNDTSSTHSDRSELAEISSSNSALQSVTKSKTKSIADENKQKNGLYAIFKTLMVRKSYSGQSSTKWNTTTNNSKLANIAVATIHTRGLHTESALNNKRGCQNDDQAPQNSLKAPIIADPPTKSFLISCGSNDTNSVHLRLEIKGNVEPKAERSNVDNKIINTDDISTDSIAVDNPMKSTHSEMTNLATATAALKRERLENRRERKAAVTLAIITGCFMLCWLPFFIEALLTPFYPELRASRVVRSILLWLGYSNSLLNPIIYTIFSPDFRDAFRKILFGRYYHRARER